jgi:large subunit ribosomal protein L32e
LLKRLCRKRRRAIEMAPEKKDKEGKNAHGKEAHVKAHADAKKESHAGHSGSQAAKEAHGAKEAHSAHAGAEAHPAHAQGEAGRVKESAKPAEKGAGAREKAVKKAVEKKAPVKISKSKEVKRLSRLVMAKKRPMFRGRFGQRSIRNIRDAKWSRWRKPRGIDIYFNKEDGLVPGTGYQRPKEIRFVHPSGYRERLVCNMGQLLALEKEKAAVAARVSGTVGRKKKELLLKKADELKIVVLNR